MSRAQHLGVGKGEGFAESFPMTCRLASAPTLTSYIGQTSSYAGSGVISCAMLVLHPPTDACTICSSPKKVDRMPTEKTRVKVSGAFGTNRDIYSPPPPPDHAVVKIHANFFSQGSSAAPASEWSWNDIGQSVVVEPQAEGQRKVFTCITCIHSQA